MHGQKSEDAQFDEDYNPKAVAGCPPDAFSASGQLWGNPLYDWKKLKKDNYGWWVQQNAESESFMRLCVLTIFMI